MFKLTHNTYNDVLVTVRMFQIFSIGGVTLSVFAENQV